MFQQFLTIFPRDAGAIALIAAAVGSLIGVALFLAGAKFSRPILTLTAVAIGTAVGMKLPLWFGWQIDGMGPGVGGAIILGVSAYALHRFWVGLWLGLVLAAWAALITWNTVNHGAQFAFPQYTGFDALPQFLMQIWAAVPDQMQRYLALLGGAAMLVGLAAALAWPRIGTALLWSAAGASLLITTGIMALSRISPSMLEHLPRQISSQLAVLCGLVTLGTLWQWHSISRQNAAESVGSDESDDE